MTARKKTKGRRVHSGHLGRVLLVLLEPAGRNQRTSLFSRSSLDPMAVRGETFESILRIVEQPNGTVHGLDGQTNSTIGRSWERVHTHAPQWLEDCGKSILGKLAVQPHHATDASLP